VELILVSRLVVDLVRLPDGSYRLRIETTSNEATLVSENVFASGKVREAFVKASSDLYVMADELASAPHVKG